MFDYLLLFFTFLSLTYVFVGVPLHAYRQKTGKIKRGSTKTSIRGYYFWSGTNESKVDLAADWLVRKESNQLADEFLACIEKNFWVLNAEYQKSPWSGCPEFRAQMASLADLAIAMEYELNVYKEAAEDSIYVLDSTLIEENIDTLLFATCYKTFDERLKKMDNAKACKIYTFCKDELSFTDPIYEPLIAYPNTFKRHKRGSIK